MLCIAIQFKILLAFYLKSWDWTDYRYIFCGSTLHQVNNDMRAFTGQEQKNFLKSRLRGHVNSPSLPILLLPVEFWQGWPLSLSCKMTRVAFQRRAKKCCDLERIDFIDCITLKSFGNCAVFVTIGYIYNHRFRTCCVISAYCFL